MIEQKKPNKRIVSKKQFLTALGSKASLSLFGIGVALIGVFGLLVVVLLAVMMLLRFTVGIVPLFLIFTSKETKLNAKEKQ